MDYQAIYLLFLLLGAGAPPTIADKSAAASDACTSPSPTSSRQGPATTVAIPRINAKAEDCAANGQLSRRSGAAPRATGGRGTSGRLQERPNLAISRAYQQEIVYATP